MRTRFLGRLVALLIASGLLLPSQAADDTKTESRFNGPKHPLDKATYLRMRLQLELPILDGKPPCELDTPAGREEELQRAIKVFPEIRKDTETLQAINWDHCFENFDILSAEQQLQIYRRYENLTSIHLEPLGRDSAGLDGYLRTFVPNHQPHCAGDPALEGKTPLVWADHGEFFLRRACFSTSIGPTKSSNARPPDARPPDASQVRLRPSPNHRAEVRRPCGPPQADQVAQRRTGPNVYAPPIPERLSHPELRYRILDNFERVWFCDPYASFTERAWEQSQALRALP